MVALFGLVAFGGAGLAFLSFSSSPPPEAPIRIESGVTPVVIDGIAVVVVRDGDDVWAFLAGDRRRERIEWCASSELFTTTEGGSAYDVTGERLAGPAPTDLDQVRVVATSDPDLFQIVPDDIEPGTLRIEGATVIDGPWQPRFGDGAAEERWVQRFEDGASYCPERSAIG